MLLNLILATWRLTSLINREDGPGDIFVRFRHVLGVRYDEHSVMYPTTNLARGVMCFWCSSVWGATVVCLLAALLGRLKWRDVPLSILAASTGAILVEELI